MPPLELIAVPAIALVALVSAVAYDRAFVRRQVASVAAEIDEMAAALASTPARSELPTMSAQDPRLQRALEGLRVVLLRTATEAAVDALTGCLNRQATLTCLADELARAERYERPLSIGLIDLDHFKQVNDTHGHAVGDLVLNHVAEVLGSDLRDVDVLGRYGGEEFLLILPETPVVSAAIVAEKLRQRVHADPGVVYDDDPIPVTVSIGVAGGVGRELALDRMIRDADASLYAAKALGRDQVYLFRESDPDRLIARRPVRAEARQTAFEVGREALAAANDVLRGRLRDRPAWAGGASVVIAEIAVSVATAIGLPEAEIERIRTASLLHDLGKLAIPDEILHKPDGLDEAEWRTVTEHPRIGQIVLEQAGALRDAAEIVLHHHEWFDGRGYPYGLSGEDIPLGARIVTIADAYEAMVSGRPYRGAISHADALRELADCAGTQFDPTLVRVFASLYPGGVDGIEVLVPGSKTTRGAGATLDTSARVPQVAPVAISGGPLSTGTDG